MLEIFIHSLTLSKLEVEIFRKLNIYYVQIEKRKNKTVYTNGNLFFLLNQTFKKRYTTLILKAEGGDHHDILGNFFQNLRSNTNINI